MYDFSDKVAVVTGTSRRKGIGCAIALRLARDGANVVVTDRPIDRSTLAPWESDGGWAGLPSVVAEIEQMGARAVAVEADVTRSDDVAAVIATAIETFGRVDFLVNNHKYFDASEDHSLSRRAIVELPDELFDAYYNVNLKGTFLTCKAAAKQMIVQGDGGKIVNIDSLAGKRPKAGMGAYSATKAGVLRLTEVLTLELGRHNINVNAICPGSTVTWGTSGKSISDAISSGLSEDEAVDKVYVQSGQFPNMGASVDPAAPEDQANAVAFLCSSEADFITGQSINVCGGQLLGA